MIITQNSFDNLPALLNELLLAKKLVYDKLGLNFTDLTIESESKEYGACIFKLDGTKRKNRFSK